MTPALAPAADAGRTRLAHAYVAAFPAEAARALEHHAAAEGAALLAEVEPADAARVLTAIETAHGAALLAAAGPERAGALVSAMPVDAAARLVRRLAEPMRAPILAHAEPAAARVLGAALDPPPDSAAALMDAHGAAVPEHLTAGEAVARVRRDRPAVGATVYLVDEAHVLTGVIGVRALLAASPRMPLAALAVRDPIRLRADDPAATIVGHPGWQRHHELPVVDGRGVLLGVFRYATMRRLEAELAPDRPPGSGLAPLVAIGELYWVGMARVLGSLVAAFGARGDAAEPSR